MRSILARALCVALLAAPGPVLAHHSFAMFDATKVVTINGTVKEFQWTNPHSVIWVLTPAPGGQTDLWTVELGTSPGNLTRTGWSKHSLNPGDKVAVDINPLRDGRHGGSLKRVLLVDSGKVLTVGAIGQPPAPTGHQP
jgi:hypothetical protein